MEGKSSLIWLHTHRMMEWCRSKKSEEILGVRWSFFAYYTPFWTWYLQMLAISCGPRSWKVIQGNTVKTVVQKYMTTSHTCSAHSFSRNLATELLVPRSIMCSTRCPSIDMISTSISYKNWFSIQETRLWTDYALVSKCDMVCIVLRYLPILILHLRQFWQKRICEVIPSTIWCRVAISTEQSGNFFIGTQNFWTSTR